MKNPRLQCQIPSTIVPSLILARTSKSAPFAPSSPFHRRYAAASASSLPRVAQPSLWHSIVPKFLRKSQNPQPPIKSQRSKDWNPATFFILIFLLIGSNAIQMITLRHDFASFSRKAEVKIGLLKELIDRVQRGENVDVEGMLGTGDEEKEREWEDVLHEIEEEDRLWQAKAKRRDKKEALKELDKLRPADSEEPSKATTVDDTSIVRDAPPSTDTDEAQITAKVQARPGFY